jgi:hypothetical protein
LGVALDWGPNPDKPFKNQCYYYGDGGYSVSVSDAYLARYLARGFSLNSLCMALVSLALFDPESGKRLPSYIIANFKNIDEQRQEGGDLTDELPLEVPDCFKRGLPYTDCTMNFDMHNGSRISAEQRQAFRDLGTAIDQAFRRAMAEGVACDEFRQVRNRCKQMERWGDENTPDHDLVKNNLAPEGYFFNELSARLKDRNSRVPEHLLAISKASFYDVSNSLPLGFGYALNADGAASGEESGTGKQAIDGLVRSRSTSDSRSTNK